MAGYLIAEEGPLSGRTIEFDQGTEWVLGRDPDQANIVLEDPMVSRKHAICRLTSEGYILENLSSVNPATQNGKIITESVLLHEGDIVQIGSTFFRFTEKSSAPAIPTDLHRLAETTPDITALTINLPQNARWVMKVISGPNAGAEFHMQKERSYIIGKDASIADIVFQDLSVSRQHARLTIDAQENLTIEDLGSLNGTLVNGNPISEITHLNTQDTVALGTTSFLVIDQQAASETIVSKAEIKIPVAEESVVAASSEWKDMVIPRKHLVVGGIIIFIALFAMTAMLSLFNSEPISTSDKDESARISEVIHVYPDIQFSYNDGSSKLFLTGHVLTQIEKQELLYQLKNLPFLQDIEDTVVIDELVWQNMNSLLVSNPDWQGISIHSPAPGKFVMRGYLQNAQQAQALADYININFPYLDRLDNQVVIETNLITQIDSLLLEKGFNNVTFELSNGELVLSGRVDHKNQTIYEGLVKYFKALPGVRILKNYTIYTTEDSSLVDLSSKYKVMGTSKKDGLSNYIVINGKILTIGDTLDGMLITNISTTMVILEKDGLKFKINYNLQ